MTFTSYIAGGIVQAEYGLYDTEGLMCGKAGVLANGEDSGMGRWLGMKSVDASVPEVERATQTGDDQRQGTITFQPTDATTLAIQMGVTTPEDEAALNNVAVYDDGQFSILPFDPYLEDLPVACLSILSTAKKRVPGQRANKGYEVNIFNYGEISAQGYDGITEREMRNYDFFMSLDQVYTWLWGSPMSQANEGTVAASGGRFTSNRLVSFHAIRGDASELSVTLDFVPIGAESVSGVVKVWKTAAADGVVTVLTPTTDYTLNASTGALALTAAGAGAEGDHFVVRYKHNGVETA